MVAETRVCGVSVAAVPTLHDAAELLLAADSLDGLVPLARAIGCDVDVAPLDARTRQSLGIDDDVLDARIASGRGALRALLVSMRNESAPRERLARLAARLSARAPHVLWIVLAVHRPTDTLAIAAWNGDRRPPRVAALVADRARLVDSDAETLRALAAAAGGRDLLTHARWVEVLGRDALTARFYRSLESAIGALAASSRAGTSDVRRELALLDASRLLFLTFLEAKGWLDSDHAFLTHQFERCMEKRGGFRDRVLRPLFFGTLNTPLRGRAAVARAFGSVPFLNGGLFSRTPLERRTTAISFSDDAYGSLLFDVFAQYRFTAREETASWNEAAVDPEMLGKAFESLMASQSRRTTGAFFTPFSLVERVTACGLDATVLDTLADVQRVTVLDPACGSGAFLVHALERLANRARELGASRPLAALRREILTRSIFGVDVNPTAVWLCQLRLWLSVVIESDETDPADVMPLPNLDRNVRVGDALRGRGFEPSVVQPTKSAALSRLRERYARATGPRKESLARELERAERARVLASIDAELGRMRERRRDLLTARRGHDLFGGRYRPSASERAAARALRQSAAALRASRRTIAAGGALPFSFSTHFADVAARGGFSLIVGNPPWVRLHRIPRDQRDVFRRSFAVARAAAWEAGAASAGAGAGFAAQIDVASLFIERCVNLLGSGGALSLLVPAKLWRSLAGGGVRQFLNAETQLLRLEDYSEAPAAFDAAVYPSLLVARRGNELRHASADLAVHCRGHDAFAWRAPSRSLVFDDSPGAPWLLLPPDARRGFDLLCASGQPLAESVIGRPYLGVKCGCNDAFVVEIVDMHGDVAEVVTSLGNAITIERSALRPLIRGERLRRWQVPRNYEAILWTHDPTGSPLSALPPLAARWFARWRHALLARSDARQRARWWTLFRIESARYDRPRVVWADMGREARASVLSAGDDRVALNSCYVARCRDETDAHAFAALLNGPLARAWLNALAEPARGGYRRYLGWTMSLLPIPTRWSDVRSQLASIGQRAAAGEHVSDAELLEASVASYGVSHDHVAPLVAWSAV